MVCEIKNHVHFGFATKCKPKAHSLIPTKKWKLWSETKGRYLTWITYQITQTKKEGDKFSLEPQGCMDEPWAIHIHFIHHNLNFGRTHHSPPLSTFYRWLLGLNWSDINSQDSHSRVLNFPSHNSHYFACLYFSTWSPIQNIGKKTL
jgi:hypothetical protein